MEASAAKIQVKVLVLDADQAAAASHQCGDHPKRPHKYRIETGVFCQTTTDAAEHLVAGVTIEHGALAAMACRIGGWNNLWLNHLSLRLAGCC